MVRNLDLPKTAEANNVCFGFVGRIPVRNLWMLMLYASDLFSVHGHGMVACEDSPEDLPNLVAEILTYAVEKRQRRQLSLGYRRRQAVLNRVRGRIDILETECGHLFAHGRVACRFDELTVDTPRNRFVRAALDTAARLVTNNKLANRCRKLASDLKRMGVAGIRPSLAEVQVERVGWRDNEERSMISAARLLFDMALPTESSGAHALPLPDREAHWVRQLFERAVGGFYTVLLEREGWQVSTGHWLDWQIEWQSAKIDSLLPKMKTDVVLEHRAMHRRIVIDTKFAPILASGWYRDETLSSGNLYQIYAYLRSQACRGNSIADQAEGVLLHPSIGKDLNEAAVIQGHQIRFVTVNLEASSIKIREQLLDVVKSIPAYEAAGLH